MLADTVPTLTERKEMFKFRVLVEFDSTYEIYIAQCLETGSIATANDPNTLHDMIIELLQDEISYAIEHQNFANLFSTPAPPDVWLRWTTSSLEEQEEKIAIHAKELRLDDQEVFAEFTVARAA